MDPEVIASTRLAATASAGYKPTLVRYPAPLLNAESHPVTPEQLPHFTPAFAACMEEFTKSCRGYSMAGVQVGIALRFFYLTTHDDLVRHGDYSSGFWVNPRIVSSSKYLLYANEGCLSMLDGFGPHYAAKKWHRVVKLSRPAEVTVEYTDPATGVEVTQECKGLLARVVQHELDHLDGILFHTRLNSLERQKFHPWLQEMRRVSSTV
jgi:peptide deformylase